MSSFWARRRHIILCVLLVPAVVVTIRFVLAQESARKARYDRMYRMYTAIHMLRAMSIDEGRLPPAVYADELGKPLFSWRFAAIPYYECGLSAIDISAGWDSPANALYRQLAPQCYCFNAPPHTCGPVRDRSLLATHVVAITGTGTAFEREKTGTWEDLPSDMVILMESKEGTAHWMAPGDVDVADVCTAQNTLDDSDEFCVAFADGQVWLLSNATPTVELCKLTTIAGARANDRNLLLRAYQIATFPD